jgi:hypothetical protein
MVCIPDWLIPTLKGGLIRGDYLLQAAKLDRGFTAFMQKTAKRLVLSSLDIHKVLHRTV